MFLLVERGRIVLEVLDQGTRLRPFIENLGLAFINAASTAHWDVPCVVAIHGFGVLRMTRTKTPRRSCREDLEPEPDDGNGTRTKPIGNLSDWAVQHNRPGSSVPSLLLPSAPILPVVLAFSPFI